MQQRAILFNEYVNQMRFNSMIFNKTLFNFYTKRLKIAKYNQLKQMKNEQIFCLPCSLTF